MNPQDMVHMITNSDTIGFKIAKEYFNWMQLDKVEEFYKASSIIYLANLIDNTVKEKN